MSTTAGTSGSGAPRAVPARFGALRDDHVGAFFEHPARLRQALHLADDRYAGRLDACNVGRGVAEGEHQRRRPVAEREIEHFRLLRQRPGDEAAADALVSRRGEFALEPVGSGYFCVAAAEQAEAAGAADRAGKRAAGSAAHRRRQNRMADAEELGQPRPQRHVILPAACRRIARFFSGRSPFSLRALPAP
jgi:hypothetical protein